MRELIVAVMIAASTVAVGGQRLDVIKEQADIEGLYWASGKDSKNAYVGACFVTKQGQGYLFQWLTVEGAPIEGVGIRNGDRVSVGWGTSSRRGVTVYRIDGKTLKGNWFSLPGDGSIFPETLTFLKSLPKE